MRDTLRYQEIGSSRKYQQPEPKSTTFIIEIKGKLLKIGCKGLHKIPKVWGACPSVQAVFQKIVEKPT